MAETARNDAKRRKDDQDTSVSAMKKAYDDLPDSDPSKPDASAKLNAEQEKALAYGKDLQAKQKNYEEAQDVTKKIEENLGKALLTAKAAAEGEAQFSEEGNTGSTKLNDNSAKHISEAATTIVDKIINKNHIVDSCISLINKFAEKDATEELHLAAAAAHKSRDDKIQKLEEQRSNLQIAIRNGQNSIAMAADEVRKKNKGLPRDELERKVDRFIRSEDNEKIYPLENKKDRIERRIQFLEKSPTTIEGVVSIQAQCVAIIKDAMAETLKNAAKPDSGKPAPTKVN